ncbi:hypothetical protein ACFU7T_31485 [Streptomyces sp. NPDC057555]|uniref:hypothetical protein n=1 Tax=Streptomyces sp. NPDC057555 TaxID=3346166 RepID=UPI0036A12BD5
MSGALFGDGGPRGVRPVVPLALGMPDPTSWWILLGFLLAVVLVCWLIGRTVRRLGGFRRACRRVVWELRTTGRAFTAPLRAYLSLRRAVRLLNRFFADPAGHDTVRAALDRADQECGTGCYAAAVHLGPARDVVQVVVAGRDPAGSDGPAAPWIGTTGTTGAAGTTGVTGTAGAGVGEWTWSASVARIDGPRPGSRLPLVLGVDRRTPGVVLVDWLRGPAALAVEGEPAVARSVLHALAAQLDRIPDGPPVRVAAGVHRRFPGPGLDDLLAQAARPTDGSVPVLVCWAPTPEQAGRLAELCAAGHVRALVGGRLPGACWTVHAEPDGRLLVPAVSVDADASALGRAVARAVRRGGPPPRLYVGDPHPPEAAERSAPDGPAAPAPTPAPVPPTTPQRPVQGPVPVVNGPAPVGKAPAPAAPAPEPLPVPADLTEPAASSREPAPVPADFAEPAVPAEPGPASRRSAPDPFAADLAEPGPAPGAPGPAGVSAASGPPDGGRRGGPGAASASDSGDSQERTPRTP